MTDLIVGHATVYGEMGLFVFIRIKIGNASQGWTIYLDLGVG